MPDADDAWHILGFTWKVHCFHSWFTVLNTVRDPRFSHKPNARLVYSDSSSLQMIRQNHSQDWAITMQWVLTSSSAQNVRSDLVLLPKTAVDLWNFLNFEDWQTMIDNLMETHDLTKPFMGLSNDNAVSTHLLLLFKMVNPFWMCWRQRWWTYEFFLILKIDKQWWIFWWTQRIRENHSRD